jgi:hypothetical protein
MLILYLDERGFEQPRLEVIRRLLQLLSATAWWRPSSEDLPLCALLSAHHGTPETIVGRLTHAYHLLEEGGLMPGSHLQEAAILLALDEREIGVSVEQFLRLLTAAEQHRIEVGHRDYDVFALISLLHDDPATALTLFTHHLEQLRAWDHHTMSPALRRAIAADLSVFVELGNGNGAKRARNVGFISLVTIIAMNAMRSPDEASVTLS